MNNKVRFGNILAHIGVDYNVADKCIANAVQLQSQVMCDKDPLRRMKLSWSTTTAASPPDGVQWAVGSRRTAGEGGRQREKAVWEGEKERVMVFLF